MKVLNVYGDADWRDDENGEAWEVDFSPPWPPSELRPWLMELESSSDDPGEKTDLNAALFALCWVEDAITKGDALQAAEFGIEIGKHLARYELRARRRGHSGGAEIKNEWHKILQGRYQSEVDELQDHGKGLSYEAATKQVAKKYGVTQKTVKNHTRNKWPSKGGRPKKT